MTRTIHAAAVSLIALASVAAIAQTTETQKQSWVAASHQTEKTPLDTAAMKATSSAVQEVMNAHDFHIALCQKVFVTFQDLNYSYRKVILDQYLLGSSAFQVEHPDIATDAPTATESVNLAGVQSVVLAYKAILEKDLAAHNKVLDDLVKKQQNGKLEEYVQKNCK